MSGLPTSVTKISSFRDEDVKDPDKLRAKLNDLVTVVRATQQVRQTFVKFSNVQPNTSNLFTVTVGNPGFVIGGIVLVGMRIGTVTQETPAAAWSIDFTLLPNCSALITGRNSGAVVANAWYSATFMLTEDI